MRNIASCSCIAWHSTDKCETLSHHALGGWRIVSIVVLSMGALLPAADEAGGDLPSGYGYCSMNVYLEYVDSDDRGKQGC